MRISGLLIVLLGGLVSVCGASDPLRQSSSPQTAANSFNSDLLSTSGILHPEFSGLAASDRGAGDYHSAQNGDLTCYTIERFLMKRESPHSDVTELAGHSTCQRASKYSVKTVQEPDKTPSH